MEELIMQNGQEISRQDIQAALAKAVELRALHATLLQRNSPTNLKGQPCASPCGSLSFKQFSAQDYPVFMPSYEDDATSEYHNYQQRLSENENGFDDYFEEEREEHENYKQKPFADRNRGRGSMSAGLYNKDQHICLEEGNTLCFSSSLNYMDTQASPANEFFKSRGRTSSCDFKTVMSCDQCKPANLSKAVHTNNSLNKHKVSAVHAKEPKIALQARAKNKAAPIFSWLFPRLKKNAKSETATINRAESNDAADAIKDWGILALESFKKQLMEAQENRDAALMEASEMKSSMTELKQKLVHLEVYCEDLKEALEHTMKGRDALVPDKPNVSRKGQPNISSIRDRFMPVTHEVMVEGFLQIVSESRLSMKQFCRTLVSQIEETDIDLTDKLNLLLQPYNVTMSFKHTKVILYHLEAILSQALYQDFENSVFKQNGCPRLLDPHQDRWEKFEAFVSLRNLSWHEVLRKGTKCYSEDFSKFCDQKMGCFISVLNWSSPWPEKLLQTFFIAAKCVWLLHLLAFSFDPPLPILRVNENRSFDPVYMDDILSGRQRIQSPSTVGIMVAPGFYVDDKVVRCKVLCKH